MIKFTIEETKEQEVVNALADCRRVQINKTITEAVIFFKWKYKSHKMNAIYDTVGSFAGISGYRVKQIYNQAPKTNA